MKLSKFHIRDLFWLVLVAAILCGWWLDQARIAKRLTEVDQQLVDVELLKAKLKAEHAVSQASLALQRASFAQMMQRLESSERSDPSARSERPVKVSPARGSGAMMLILESEYHQMLIEGKPIQ